MKKAFITGITGQDGTYLAELLAARGFELHGFVRRSTPEDDAGLALLRALGEKTGRPARLYYGDLDETACLERALDAARPEYIFNFGGLSSVGESFSSPEQACETSGLGPLRMLEWIRRTDAGGVRFFQAGSAEIFGEGENLSETSPVRPMNPYGCAKALAQQMIDVYRRSYGMFACSALYFSHESPRRGRFFATRKIASAAARIGRGSREVLRVGAIDNVRDWGYAPDYVAAALAIISAGKPSDYVVATGTGHTLRDFINLVFERCGVTLEWRRDGAAEWAVNKADGKTVVEIDRAFFRPSDPKYLVGNPSKIKTGLGWRSDISFAELAALLADAEIKSL